MRRLATLIGLAGLAVLTNTAYAQIPAGSTWENQRGSTLQITSIDSNTGALRGQYINRAVGFKCQGTPYDVTGWVVDGDKIAFSVRWRNSSADCKSITSWTGYLDKGFIVTDWDLAYTDTDLGHPIVIRGSDTFQKK